MTETDKQCGKIKYHDDPLDYYQEDDPIHGEWTRNPEGWQCQAKPMPNVQEIEGGRRAVCVDCSEIFATTTAARQHWWVHLRERRALKPIKHGTDAGYYSHRRRDEPACGECKAGHALATKRKLNGWERANHAARRPAFIFGRKKG